MFRGATLKPGADARQLSIRLLSSSLLGQYIGDETLTADYMLRRRDSAASSSAALDFPDHLSTRSIVETPHGNLLFYRSSEETGGLVLQQRMMERTEQSNGTVKQNASTSAEVQKVCDVTFLGVRCIYGDMYVQT